MSSENKNSSLFDLAELKELGGFQAGDLLAVDPQLYSKFMKHLDKTVKHDEVTKNIVFLTGISAYTDDPINLFLRGESSIGKTYNVTETLKYFPKDDVWLLGGLSPTALIHSKGKLFDKNGEEIDLLKKPEKPRRTDYGSQRDYLEALHDYKENRETWVKRLRESHYLVDLSGKVLVFLEAPNIKTFNMLRPILSHDSNQISYKFTDKTASGKLQTQHVVIQGFPATIFCTTQERYVKDLATRSFTVTPETTAKKYKAACLVTAEKAAYPWKFQRDSDFMLLEGYIRFLSKNLKDFQVLIPYAEDFARNFQTKFPRNMRDHKHILSLMKVSTLFRFAQRPVLTSKNDGQTYVMAVREDFEFIMSLWNEIRETTETSAPGHIMKFFHDVLQPLSKKVDDSKKPVAVYIEDLVDGWNGKFEAKRSSDVIRKWIDFLAQIGYVSKTPDSLDKRRNVITVIKENEKNGNYTQIKLSEIFKLDSFKAWLNEAEKYCGNKVTVNKEKKSNVETSPEDLFNIFFLNTHSSIPQYFPKRSTASLSESTPEKTDNLKSVQYPLFTVDEVLKLERLTTNIKDECVACGFQGRMDWQVTLHDQTWNMLCDQCGLKLNKQLREVE